MFSFLVIENRPFYGEMDDAHYVVGFCRFGYAMHSESTSFRLCTASCNL